MNAKKIVDCEFFLPYSKVCSAPAEMESPPGHCINCLFPEKPNQCPVKKYYDDSGPYVCGERISLFKFIQAFSGNRFCGMKDEVEQE